MINDKLINENLLFSTNKNIPSASNANIVLYIVRVETYSWLFL